MRIVDRIVDALMALILAALVAVAFAAVVFRYALDSALSWSFEASLVLLTYLTFIGCFAALRHGAHLKVDVIATALPGPLRAGCFVVVQLVVLGICSVMVVWGAEQALKFANETTTMLGLPRGPIYAVIPLSGLAMGVDTIVRLAVGLRRAANGETPEPELQDHAQEL